MWELQVKAVINWETRGISPIVIGIKRMLSIKPCIGRFVDLPLDCYIDQLMEASNESDFN